MRLTKKALTPNVFPPQSGDHHSWAAKWVTNSRITGLTNHGTEIVLTTMSNFNKADYIAAHQAAERQQLLKASCRLGGVTGEHQLA